MKRKLLFIFLLLSSFGFKLSAQITETEPNDNVTDSGVKTITANGTVNGVFTTIDTDIFLIAPGASGTISVTFNSAPSVNSLQLFQVGNGTALAACVISQTFTYALNPNISYYLKTFTGLATGSWQYTISGLLNDGQALFLDGVNDRVIVSNGANLNNKSFTVEFWTKRTTNGTSDYVFGQGPNIGTDNALHIGFRNSNDFTFAFYSDDINVTTPASTDGNYHHWACVYQSGTSSGFNKFVYLDGVLVTAVRSIGDLNVTGALDFVIGEAGYYASFGGNDYAGYIDELRVWTEARTQCQIQDFMNCEIPTTATNLVANYHFNQGINAANNSAITTLTDASGNSRTGSLNNFALNGTTSNWSRLGGVVSSFTTDNTPLAEINLKGNGSNIINNSTTATTANGTDFGTASTRTFVIENLGTDPLNLYMPYLTGANAASFSVVSLSSTSVAAGGTASVVVNFIGTAMGTYTATLNILNNDCDEPVYNFVIKAIKSPNGVSLDGINDYVNCGVVSAVTFSGSSAYSVEAWIKRRSGAGGSIVAMNNAGISAAWQMSVTTSGQLIGYRNASGTNSLVATSTITPDVWTHVAMTYNGAVLILWINGVTAGSASMGSIPVTTASLMIGAGMVSNAASQFFSGEIDNVSIWNLARGIATDTNVEVVGNETNLVTSYNFNYGSPEQANAGYTISPSLPATYPGTLTNMALSGCPSNWVCGAPVLGGCTPLRNVIIQGNSTTIVNGNTVTSTTDFSSFGNVTVGSSLSRTFAIQNTGSGTLTISGYSLTGANASSFTVTTAPSSPLTASGTTSIVVAFSPTIAGLKSASLSINSDDCDKPSYTFNIDGTGVTPGAALDFGGSLDYVSIPNTPSLNVGSTSDFTNECWIKHANSQPNYAGLIAQGSSALGNWHQMVLYNNKLSYELYSNNSGISLVSNTSLNDGNWHHVAMVVKRSTNNVSLYVDGLLEATTTNTFINSDFGDATRPLFIGVDRGGGTQYGGIIDEVRFWNVARSQCEILTTMRCEVNSGTGLVASYHFNQGAASGSNTAVITATDATGNGNTGTLTNFTLTGSTSNWVTPGGVVSGSTTASAPTAVLAIKGNGTTIANGTTVTGTGNFTDFGTAVTRTFVSTNTPGTGTLYINSVTLSGANAADFSIATLPATAITTGTTNFVINFIPTALGSRTAIVSVNSSDCTSPNYSFVISGTGVAGAALNFDGTNDYADVFNSLTELGLADFTEEAWIKTTGNNMGVLSCQNNNTTWESGEKHLYVKNDGTINFTGNGCGNITTTTTVNDGNWHHVAVVWDLISGVNGIGKIYVDGIDRTTLSTYQGNMANLGTFKIGIPNYNESTQFFLGNMDDIRFWNVARTQCQIMANMNCEIPNGTPNIVGNYHCNTGIAFGVNTGNSILSTSAGSSHGSLISFAVTGATSNWVAPGAVVTGSFTPATPSISILVLGNGNTIAAGTVATNTTNFTNFGSATARTFSIANTGTVAISISSITLSGANASDFSLTTLSSSIINVGAGSSFTFSFIPSAVGSRSANVIISSNDCTSPNYSFVITGSATAASALAFDGTDDYVLMQDPNFGLSDFTIESWVKPNAFASNQYILSTRNSEGGNGNYWDLGIFGSTGGLYFETANTGAVPYTTLTSPTSTLTAGAWQHIAVTRSSTLVSIYINGQLTASSAWAGVPNLVTGNNTLRISGSGINAAMLNGSVDEVRVWNTARSQCQIQTYMNAEIPSNASGLLYNYHFNQGISSGNNTTITTLTDVSGNNNNGTLNTFALTSGNSTSNWVSPGGVVNGYTTVIVPSASLVVTGNSNTIIAGSTLTGTNNFTDFGNANTRTFVVKNYATGTNTLYVNGITLSGANAGDFSVTTLPATSLNALGTSNFVIAFNPSIVGTSSAMVTVNSSDCNSPNYSFIITGSVSAASALSFDGNDDYVSNIPNINLTSQFTIEFWAKRNTNTTQDYVLAQGTNTTDIGLHVGFYASSSFNFGFWGDDLNYGFADLAWHHWAAVYNPASSGINRLIYMDGILVASDKSTGNYTGSGPITLGSTPWALLTDNFDGKIDELRIWTAARSQCDIQTYMNSEITSTATSLAANYHFNQGVAGGNNAAVTTLTDASTNANTGTLNNFSLTGTVSNWVSPGGVANGSTTTAVPNVEIDIQSNGNAIADGSTTTFTTNNTNFGTVCANVTTTKTFTVFNTGTATLALNSASVVGANAGLFTLSALPSVVAASSSVTFAVTFSAAASGTNTAIININSNDCDEALYDFVITASVSPAPVISTNDVFICQGQTTTLTASGASTYTYTGGGPVVAPFSTTHYFITGTSSLGCVGTNTADATVYVNAIPPVSIAGSNTVCSPGSVTLTASNANTYTWSTGATGSVIVLSPTITTSYTVIAAYANGCSNTAVKIVSVNNSPTITVNSGTVCSGSPFTITPSGAPSYSYSNGGPVVSPTVTTNYSVTGTSSLGCLSTVVVSNVSVVPLPTVSIVNYSICNGGTATLSPSGAVSYTFQGGSATVSPTTTTSYTVAGANVNGCVNTVTTTVTVNNLPTLAISTASAGICNGASTTLSVTGAITYTWSNALQTTTISVSPTTNTSYSVNGTDANGCINSATQAIVVNALPTITINNAAICPGNSYTLVPSGASTYSYSSGSNVVTPTITSSYSVTGTSSAGCVASTSAVATVSVVNTLTVNVTGNTTICQGSTATLTASGATTYSWNTGVTTNTITLSPSANTTYTVYGASGTCSNNAVVSVSVNAAPTITATGGTICYGTSFTITPSGAQSYSYSSGSAVVSPTSNTSYSVTGTNSLGCVSIVPAIITVAVNATPTLNIATTTPTVCSGAVLTLSVSGASTYTWSNALQTTSISVNPAVNTTYTVSGTDANNCVGTASQVITVNPLPTITINNAAICPGNSFTLVPSGASTYTYSSGSNVVTPAATTNYSITGTSSLGCVASASAVVTVSVVNTVTVTVTGNTVICAGQTASLTAGGASTYLWSNGITTNTINLSPTANTTYTIYGASGTCSNSAVVSVSVNAVPTITVNSGAICSGSSFTMVPGGASSYTFSSGSNVVSPVNTSTYYVAGTNSANCVSTTSAISIVTVNASPTLAITSPTGVCNGSAAILSVSGALSYTWNTTSQTNTISVTPAGNTTYSVTGLDVNNCAGTASQVIAVNPLPTITVPNGAICPGNTYTLMPSGATTYSYSSGSNVVTPIVTTSYSVTGTSSAGCVASSSAVATVSVVNTLSITVSGNTVICTGRSATLTAGGASTYSWTNGALTNTVILSPTSTTDYTVYGASGTCSNSAKITISVNTLPSISVSSGTVCAGSPFTLNPIGASTYTFEGGSSIVAPSVTSSYSITGTDINGCISSNTAIATITVSALPSVSIAINTPSVCAGETVTLTASGATTYSWSSGETASVISATPVTTTIYSVRGTDAIGCSNTSTLNAYVNAAPVLTLNPTHAVLCSGDSVVFTASGASTYSWSGHITNGVSFTPTASANYTVLATGVNGCTNTAVASVTVSSSLSMTVVSSNSIICEGESATLTASGAQYYTWSPDTFKTAAIVVLPTRTANVYTVSGKSNGGCKATVSFTQAVEFCLKDSTINIVTGITPNGDGKNDIWIIKNIEHYQENTVSVFNRWGTEVYKVKGYNNADKSWPDKSDASKLPPSTYFYIIDLHNGSKVMKGWVELVKSE